MNRPRSYPNQMQAMTAAGFRRLAGVILSTVAIGARTASLPALPALGGTHDLMLRDAARDRNVPIKVYGASRPGVSPLILFSPGFGGSKDGYEYLGRGWSDAGYVVVIMTHLGSDEEAVRRYGASLSRDPRASFG